MSIFNLISNYRKAKEYDKLKKSMDAFNNYVSLSVIKRTPNECVFLKAYTKDIFETSEGSELLHNFNKLNNNYYALKLENLKLNYEKLTLEKQILENKINEIKK